MWRERLPAAAVRILNTLMEVYPDALDREELAERTGLTASGGTFGRWWGCCVGTPVPSRTGENCGRARHWLKAGNEKTVG
jgi:hypothetical protein